MDTNTGRDYGNSRGTGTDGVPSPKYKKGQMKGGVVVKQSLPWNVQSFLR